MGKNSELVLPKFDSAEVVLEVIPQKPDGRKKKFSQKNNGKKRNGKNSDDFDNEDSEKKPIKIKFTKRRDPGEIPIKESEDDGEFLETAEGVVGLAMEEDEKKEAESADSINNEEIKVVDEMSLDEKDDTNEELKENNFDRKSVMNDFNSFFDELRTKLEEFEEKCKDDNGKKACEKLGKNIRYWARKINDFESIKNPSNEDIEKIMQLHDEIEKKKKEDWLDLYEEGKLELTTRDDLEKEREKVKNMEEKHAFSRKVADIARVKTDNYEKLNGGTDEERDEKFKNEIRRILKDNLVVHGKLKKDKKTGEFYVEKKPDLDCKASLELIKMAKIKIDNKKIHYEREGGSVPGRINIDTGGMDGLVVLEDGTVFIDHHGKESGNRTSATEKTLEVLIGAGLLKDYKYLRNLVSFVNRVDNFNYPKSYFEKYFTESWKTLYGLSSMLDGHELRKFFECKDKDGKPFDPGEPMDDELMRKIGVIRTIKDRKTGEETLINKPASRKEWVLKAREELDLMEKEGFIIESERYGKICLNIDRRMECGTDAAKAFGCDTYLAWNNNSNNFFISSLNREKLEDEFTDGKNIRGTMWINPVDNKRKVTLEEILNKMTDGKLEPSEEVKKALEVSVIKDTVEDVKDMKDVSSDIEDEAKEENSEPVLTDLSHEEIGHTGAVIQEEPLAVEEFEFEDDADNLTEIDKKAFAELLAEKKIEIETQLEKIEFEFGDFLESHLKEAEFNHIIQKEIIVLGELLKELQKVKEGDYETHTEHEKILKLIHESDSVIKISSKDAWEQRLKEFKGNSEKEGIEFSDTEKKIVEKSKEIIAGFIEDFRDKFDWDKFPKKKMEEFLDIQSMAFLMKSFTAKKWFIGNEENVAEFIVKNRNKNN